MPHLIGIDVQECRTGLVHESVRWEVIASTLATLGLPTAIAGLYLDGVKVRMSSIPETVIKDWAATVVSKVEPVAFLSSASTGPEWQALRAIGRSLHRLYPGVPLWTYGPHAARTEDGPEWHRLGDDPFLYLSRIYSWLKTGQSEDIGAMYSQALLDTFGPDHIIGASWTSDGCPCSCSFCLPRTFAPHRWSARAYPIVFEEVRRRAQAGYSFVRLIDLNITGGGIARFLDLCTRLQSDFPDIHFWCDASAEMLLKAPLSELAGLPRRPWTVQLGLEAIDRRSRSELERPALPIEWRDRLAGLPEDTAVRLSMITFFPWSTPRDIAEVIEFALTFPHLLPPDTLFRRLRLYEGLPITNRLRQLSPTIPTDTFEIPFYPEEQERLNPSYFHDSQLGERASLWFEENRHLLTLMRRVRGYRIVGESRHAFGKRLLQQSADELARALALYSSDTHPVPEPDKSSSGSWDSEVYGPFESRPFTAVIAHGG